MSAYADTAFLCSVYAPDANTPRANARLRRLSVPLPLHWLHQVELRNAFRLRVFRKEIRPEQRESALNAVSADFSGGRLVSIDPPMRDLLMESERLSATFTEKTGARSLDVLHVACAIVTGASEFLGFDERQLGLARLAGLKTPKL
jgi:predicted nucleic acid-binding protein